MTERLRRRDFEGTTGPVNRTHGSFFSLSVSKRGGGKKAAYACVVSKKVAPGAVQRNKIKRLCREAARVELARVEAPLAFVFSAKRSAREATLAGVRDDIGRLVRKVLN